MTKEIELKKKELERLLQENKIELGVYLETVARLEVTPSPEELNLPRGQSAKSPRLMKMDSLLFTSPFLILIGWVLSVSGSVSGYESTLSLYQTVGYPYSPIGLVVMMSATITLSLGVAYRWMKSVSRGAFIVLEVLGWFFLILAVYVLATGFSIVWVQQTAYSWYSFASINPAVCSVGLLLWFIGIFAVTCGLVPLRKWFGKGVS